MKLKNILEVYSKRTSELNRYMQNDAGGARSSNFSDLQDIETVRAFIKCVLFSLDRAHGSRQLQTKDLLVIIKFMIDRDDSVVEVIHDCLIDISDSYNEDEADPTNTLPIISAMRKFSVDDYYRLFSDLREKLDSPGMFSMYWHEKFPADINSKLLFAWHSLEADGIAYGHTKTSLRLKQSKVLPPNTWVVHFSRNAKEVAEDGFKFGTPTKHNLSLTTQIPKRAKTGGYNFGFLADGTTAINYADEYNSHYGNDFVMFQAAGSLFYHETDHEEQFVFDGTALNNKNFVYVRHKHPEDHDDDDDGPVKRFQVLNYHTGKPIYIGDYVAVVRWIKDNYNQRKGDICPAEAAAIAKQQQVSKPKG
jgi:hypothetical protein